LNELTRREREQQKMIETIIATAGELFCKQGYENTSMDDIAKASEYTKRTIYKYFTNKEDLFFAVALKGYQQLTSTIGTNNGQSSGFDKIRSAYYGFYEFYKQFPQLLQLINMSGIIKSASTNSETPYMLKFMEVDKKLFESILSMFMAGKADRSIRADVDLAMLAFSSVYMATGFFQMLSLSGDTYTSHFGMDKDLFVKFSIDMMLDTLRSKDDKNN
jgi:AcrR family transcriptional regulator